MFSHIFIFFVCVFCLYVSVCVSVCVSLSWIAVEICELNVQSLFVCFLSLCLLVTYILESLVLLKVLWCFGTVTFLVMIFFVLAIGKEGLYVLFDRVSSKRGICTSLE